ARELLQEALRNYRGTVIMVSHDIEFVRNVATTIWEVKAGKTVKFFGKYDYYLEKSAAAGTAVPAGAAAITPEGAPSTQLSAAERRRSRAQARNAISGELRRMKNEVEKLEKMLDEQSSAKAVIIAKMSSGEKVDFAKLNCELATLDKTIAKTEEAWENAAMELEALRLENDRINSENR
ncbi:MAG: hypothetical protein IKD22_05445, partial [Lentisphaeria bacterium]|nr:hypothetical protein [Lentisphaeria bacterium]